MEIRISKGNVKPFARASITLKREDNEYIGEADIANNDNTFKGLGFELWGISRDVIQEFANKLKLPVIDRVVRYPNEDDSPFGERFEQIFPVLNTEQEYVYKANDTWERKYFPILK